MFCVVILLRIFLGLFQYKITTDLIDGPNYRLMIKSSLRKNVLTNTRTYTYATKIIKSSVTELKGLDFNVNEFNVTLH